MEEHLANGLSMLMDAHRRRLNGTSTDEFDYSPHAQDPHTSRPIIRRRRLLCIRAAASLSRSRLSHWATPSSVDGSWRASVKRMETPLSLHTHTHTLPPPSTPLSPLFCLLSRFLHPQTGARRTSTKRSSSRSALGSRRGSEVSRSWHPRSSPRSPKPPSSPSHSPSPPA